MRDPKRIKRILGLVGSIWEKYPDLRLCQLLDNCFPIGETYYAEDDALEVKLKETYKEE